MKVEELLTQLDSLDVRVWADGNRIRVNAPKGVLTAELQAAIREHLTELLERRPAGEPPRPTILSAIERRPNPEEPAPLSFAQKRLWLLDRLEAGSTAYNMAAPIRLRGALDPTSLGATLSDIVRRHESLRTRFQEIDGEPRQVIDPPSPVALPITDLSALSEPQRQAETARLVREEGRRPFDLARGPLLRVGLLKLAENDHVLLLTVHHIVADGWSFGLLFQEIAAGYTAIHSGQPIPVGELPIQYADFARWQRECLEGPLLDQHVAYWKTQLGGRLPILDLPLDRPRPPIRTYRGGHELRRLDPVVSEIVSRFCRAEGVTPFMTMLAAFVVLLNRVSGQGDIVIGTPSAGRDRPEIESVIGFFVNTLVLRVDVSDNPSFRDVVHRVRQVSLDAAAHQDVPFETLLEELKPDVDLSRTPLFQVFFNSADPSGGQLQLSGVTAEAVVAPDLEAKFDLTLYIQNDASGSQLLMVYNADLFDGPRIAELLDQYRNLVSQAIHHPDAPIASHSLVTEGARSILPDPTKPLATSWAGSIVDRFATHARDRAQDPAIESSDGVWSYGLLDRTSSRLANHLQTRGVQSGDVVAVIGTRSPALVLGMLGILRAGAAFVVLDPAYPTARLLDTLAVAKPKLVLGVDRRFNPLEELGPVLDADQVVALPATPAEAGAFLPDESETAPTIQREPDGLAYVGFTSGTTGRPKGIKGTDRPLGHFLEWYQAKYSLTPDDRFSLLSGLSHDPLLRDVFAPLWTGGTLCIPEPETLESPSALRAWLASARVSVTHLTPAMGQLLRQDPAVTNGRGSHRPAINTLRLACFGADRLTARHIRDFRELAPQARVVGFYGATETPQAMGFIDLVDPTSPADPVRAGDAIPIGTGIADVQLLVLDEREKLAGIGELGEIFVRSPYLSPGYLDDETLSRQRFLTNPFTGDPADRVYRTGDLGRYRPDGQVEFLGRKDRQVKLRGFRIELAEVESVLATIPGVRQVFATLRQDHDRETQLVAYVVADKTLSQTEVRRHVGQRLPGFMVPSATVTLDRFPTTPNGKVDARALPAPSSEIPLGTDSALQPRNPVELELCRLWKEALGIDAVHPRDNFFDLGGHSLVAVKLFQLVEVRFGKRLSLATLFSAPTVEQLAAVLSSDHRLPQSSPLVPIEARGTKPPFFCVHGIGGNVLNYYELASELGRDQPFYALQSIGVEGQAAPLTRIEDMADRYLAEIRSVQPHGPYFLGGGCMGGVVAFAIAERLQRQGETVGLLAFLDVPAPIPLNGADRLGQVLVRWRAVSHLVRIGGRLQTWWRQPRGSRLRRLVHRTRDIRDPEGIRNALVAHHQEVASLQVHAANYWAMRAYRIGDYHGRIVHFFSARPVTEAHRDRRLDWTSHATEGQEVTRLTGEDSGAMLVRPHVTRLAAGLRQALDDARAALGTQRLPADPTPWVGERSRTATVAGPSRSRS